VRRLQTTACAIVIALGTTAAHAQTAYPSKPVRIVVPYPPGGGNDVLARIFGQKLSEAMGQQFVVENRPGAGTIIGTAYVAQQVPPDGYTLLLSSIATHAFAPFLYAKPGYDPIRDFAPITLLAISPTILVVNPSMPVKNVKELIALAKAFNVTNGEPIRWMNLWPAFARYFRMEAGPVRPQRLGETMPAKKHVWMRIARERGLVATSFEQLVLWPYGDFVFQPDWDIFSSTLKLRAFGFHEVLDTERMFLEIFDLYRREKVIPAA
jgi:hypothetical protein